MRPSVGLGTFQGAWGLTPLSPEARAAAKGAGGLARGRQQLCAETWELFVFFCFRLFTVFWLIHDEQVALL